MKQRLVVARHAFGGIGDHISCLVGAWYYAKRTGRTLVVDWRGSRFNVDPTLQSNAFETWFQPLGTIDGVEIVSDDRVTNLGWPDTIWPPKWRRADLTTPVHMRHSADELRQTSELIAAGTDRAEDVVVFNSWLDPWPPKQEARRLFKHLRFVSSIDDRVTRFKSGALHDMPSIAIHIRHGNGENIGKRASYWLSPMALVRQLLRNRAVSMHGGKVWGRFNDNMPDSLVGARSQQRYERAFLRRVAENVDRLRGISSIEKAIPILYTDAPHLFSVLQQHLPDLIRFEPNALPVKAGPLHQVEQITVEGRQDAILSTIVDRTTTEHMMFELAMMRTAVGMVYMDSGFTAIARTEIDDDHLVVLAPTSLNQLILKIESRL